MGMSAIDVVQLVKDRDIKMLDFKFVDLPGIWQHYSIPAHRISESLFEEGIGFDGSSIRGFAQIQESDMLVFPDPETAFVDTMLEVPTLSLTCNIRDPLTLEPFTRDPRYIAQKAEKYLLSTGIGEVSYWGPEAEFYIFNDIRFDQGPNFGFYYIDSREGIWNSGKDEKPNLGYRPRHKEGYFPVPPMDTFQDLRSAIMLAMEAVGIRAEVHHHEVATAGQAEIDMKYDSLVRMADKVMLFKYIVKNVCRKAGFSASFMPKPIFQDNGSGMHVHISIWKGGTNLFYDERGYAGLSPTARYFIGGLLYHAPALLAFAAPSTNSYRRLVPGFEAPVNLVYSQRNRSAAVRIPMYSKTPASKRLEFRCPDPSCNPYLTFAALLMAGLDGVMNKIDPGEAMDKNLYDLPPEEKAMVKSTPSSLEEVLRELEADHEFLLRGDVFTPDVIETWVRYKTDHELDPVRLRPHPYEFFLYYDI
ncbi:MAG: type I glutamate--ammonia ligase [Acidobacteria bacterium]|nr:type I glutamate--ammonia ligase [Acidobacteriota bacterium]